MTERKPPEITFASWVDQQVHEAAERGAFDNLPGAGKPLPRWGGTDDGQAWLRDYLRREGVSAEELLPTPLRLRKEIERLTGTVQDLPSERAVREVVRELNRRILEWRRVPLGPPVYLRLVDEDALTARWREAHPRPPGPARAVRGPARADRGRADRGRADRGRADRGRADRGRADRGRADRGRAQPRPRWWRRFGRGRPAPGPEVVGDDPHRAGPASPADGNETGTWPGGE